MDYLFLDFDGVLCDSVQEAYITSYISYKEKGIPQASLEAYGDLLKDLHFKKFKNLRPFIRTGYDFIILQKIIEENQGIKSQKEYDDYVNCIEPFVLELYKKDFYETRSLLLEQHKDFWLSLNPFYEGLIPLLHPLGENVFIISTKKKSFLLEILKHSKINFKEENVFCSEEKYDLMHSLLNNQEVGQVYFIDDQSSHFKQDALIKGYLALWGYIKPEETYTNAIDFLAFKELLKNFGG